MQLVFNNCLYQKRKVNLVFLCRSQFSARRIPVQPVFNLFSDRRYYRENFFLSSNYMGLGTGVRGGKNPPLPISSLGLPPPSLPPFPVNFFFSSPWKVCYRAKLYQFFASEGKKKEGSEWGKKEKCDLVRYFAKREERVYRGRE